MKIPKGRGTSLLVLCPDALYVVMSKIPREALCSFVTTCKAVEQLWTQHHPVGKWATKGSNRRILLVQAAGMQRRDALDFLDPTCEEMCMLMSVAQLKAVSLTS